MFSPERPAPLPSPPSLVTVVVVNWNRRELLRACLASLERQTGCNARFDLVLVDNGSADQSVEMARREFGRSPAFTLRVIENSDNRGFCAANNQGMAVAETPYIALLNNDAEAEPGWLAALCEALERPPRSRHGRVEDPRLGITRAHRQSRPPHLPRRPEPRPRHRRTRPRAVRPGRRGALARRLRLPLPPSHDRRDRRLRRGLLRLRRRRRTRPAR
ncbi:MAG: glycosyltransferase [Bryobacterales bacterium]|nr:glycosyltransferase [Bryobacterales bacterium]